MHIIDGNAIAESILADVVTQLDKIKHPIKPTVVFIRVGEDPASIAYVKRKQKIAEQVGIGSQLIVFPETIIQKELVSVIQALNYDVSVHGILVQAPLPKHICSRTIFNAVSPQKDVDGFNSFNLGLLGQEDKNAFVPCTPAGIIEMLIRSKVKIEGQHVVILGRSLIVGKPLALLLMGKSEQANATVTVCHSQTHNLIEFTKKADILIAAMGQPLFVKADMVSAKSIIIDVGINRINNPSSDLGYRLVGDVDFESVAPKAAMITPVPGGVGPMTVAMLMKNTLKAYLRSLQHEA